MPPTITVQTTIKAPLDQVWKFWNEPEHITHWAFASDDWEAPEAKNDLHVGGKFSILMSAKDKSASFNFNGVYSEVVPRKLLAYTIEDGRTVRVEFAETAEGVTITETFVPENINSEEMQRGGWQAILENFRKYAESKS